MLHVKKETVSYQLPFEILYCLARFKKKDYKEEILVVKSNNLRPEQVVAPILKGGKKITPAIYLSKAVLSRRLPPLLKL